MLLQQIQVATTAVTWNTSCYHLQNLNLCGWKRRRLTVDYFSPSQYNAKHFCCWIKMHRYNLGNQVRRKMLMNMINNTLIYPSTRRNHLSIYSLTTKLRHPWFKSVADRDEGPWSHSRRPFLFQVAIFLCE